MSNRKQLPIILILTLFVITIVNLTVIGGEEPVYGGTKLRATAAPTIFNPIFIHDVPSWEHIPGVFEGMVRRCGFTMKLVPNLAKSWEVSDDGLTWTFHLRDDVYWHDGVKFTAHDVVFTFRSILNRAVGSPRIGTYRDLVDIYAVDDYTVVAVWAATHHRILTDMAHAIIPKHMFEGLAPEGFRAAPASMNPIGTGMYRFVRHVPGEFTEVEANENWWRGRPYIDRIFIRIIPDAPARVLAFEAGELHATGITTEEWDRFVAMEGVRAFQFRTFGYNYLGWNFVNPDGTPHILGDVRVRQALTYAMDRQAIIDHILLGFGEVAHSALPSISAYFNPNVRTYPFDPERAVVLLREAGWYDSDGDGIVDKDHDGDGVREPLEFELQTNAGNVLREQAAVAIQFDLAAIGVTVNLRFLEWSAFLENMRGGRFDAVIAGWSLGPDPWLAKKFHSRHIGPFANRNHYRNPIMDELLDKAYREVDVEERTRLFHKIQYILSVDLPYTFLWFGDSLVAIWDIFGGPVYPTAIGLYHNFHEWWMFKEYH
ncbi:peptide-binding protein [Candidatus Acetothermia bacterium]|jgi:peptide/nickel transport system substrate-binding protein|nr:peptide-binding protein [Candidatus Acetothermia bacterium]MCI2427419.1 peptide-binding protein [Candidatus Acetothermia bacterium]MCI2428730.1 peptide-binding protein [Candidatus Acetothermia bacterium]